MEFEVGQMIKCLHLILQSVHLRHVSDYAYKLRSFPTRVPRVEKYLRVLVFYHLKSYAEIKVSFEKTFYW